VIELPLKVLLDVEFDKWAQKAGVTDEAIRKAANEIERGLVDARLGGFLVKKRIPGENIGKRGGYRIIVAYREGNRIVFLYGFAKKEADNISTKERRVLVKLGDVYMAYSSTEIIKMVDQHLLREVGL
jgi:hypothetical protein